MKSGLGNLRQNALPACQLHRLQRMVNALYEGSSHLVPFWIDTVCVPLKYPYRGIAINSMRKTYKEADKVLVLDSAITESPSPTLDSTEILMRLRASSWVRRLWTFQEAYLARELHYQFQDVALKLSDIREKYHREHDNNQIIQNRFDAIKDSQLASNTLQMERIKIRLEAGNLVFRDAYHFLEQVEAPGKGEPKEDHARLRSIIHSLRWRTTSRMEDETICLSGCIDRTVEDLTYEPSAVDRSKVAVARMKIFLSSLRTVPVGILFVDRPRIEDEGCRWMPTTFLGGGMDSTLPDTWQKENKVVTGRPTPSGLTVALPGINLSDVTKYTQNFRGNHTHDIIFISVDNRPYYVYGLMTKSVQWDGHGDSQLALILREEVDQRGTFACLVTMSVQTAEARSCKFESCVMIMGNPEVHRNLEETTFSKAEVLYGIQTWCVA